MPSVLIALMKEWICGCLFTAILEVLKYNKRLITMVRNWLRDIRLLESGTESNKMFSCKMFLSYTKSKLFFPLLSSRNGFSKILSLWSPFWFFTDKQPDTLWSRISYSVQMLIFKLVLCLLTSSISVRRN